RNGLGIEDQVRTGAVDRPRVRHRPDNQVAGSEGIAEDGVGAEQEFGAVARVLELALARRLRRPDGVPYDGGVVRVARVEEDRGDVRGTRDERPLGDGVDLRAPEPGRREVELVRGEKDCVPISADVRIIAEART